MQSLYISRVKIKNFRNFKDVDVNLGHKEVIIGENNVGKTNFLRALQLILDPSLSDEDRMLDESDFNDTLTDPMDNDEEIQIDIYISDYKNNKTLLTVLQDATVKNADGNEILQITYRFFPHYDDSGNKEYEFNIYKANDEAKKFGSYERKYLNLKVIKALRDVESEMRNSRTSPVKKMLDEYSIDREELKRIADEYEKSSKEILNLDELIDLTSNINKRFSTILGNDDFDVSLQAMQVDPNRVISSLKLLMSNRDTADISLGLNNILYISMILQMLQDKTVPSFLRADIFVELKSKEDSQILEDVYVQKPETGNYFLKRSITDVQMSKIYSFMDKNAPSNKGVTIIAIEEPEAHLHPVNQRLIYRDVIKNSNNSVLLTTHSTHITAIAPIDSIVHLHEKKGHGTIIHATADMPITAGEFLDVERYLDVKRGEIYLGKAVILVEGIAEEYLIPRFAEALGKSLDDKGIIVCNINCTNFTPYVKLLKNLDIPYSVITDGDHYYIEEKEKKGGDGSVEIEEIRHYHVMDDDVPENAMVGYLGNEIITKLFTDLEFVSNEDIPEEANEQDKLFNSYGFFIGAHTFEVDMMEQCKENKRATNVIIDIFNELTTGGETQKSNFANELRSEDYWKCLSKIEGNGIGKGRFAQKLAGRCCNEQIPWYIKNAIDYIYQKVNK